MYSFSGRNNPLKLFGINTVSRFVPELMTLNYISIEAENHVVLVFDNLLVLTFDILTWH